MGKETPVCCRCGSDDIQVDAWAYWNPEKRIFELGDVYDGGEDFCGECRDTTETVWVDVKISVLLDPEELDCIDELLAVLQDLNCPRGQKDRDGRIKDLITRIVRERAAKLGIADDVEPKLQAWLVAYDL